MGFPAMIESFQTNSNQFTYSLTYFLIILWVANSFIGISLVGLKLCNVKAVSTFFYLLQSH